MGIMFHTSGQVLLEGIYGVALRCTSKQNGK